MSGACSPAASSSSLLAYEPHTRAVQVRSEIGAALGLGKTSCGPLLLQYLGNI